MNQFNPGDTIAPLIPHGELKAGYGYKVTCQIHDTVFVEVGLGRVSAIDADKARLFEDTQAVPSGSWCGVSKVS